MPYSKRIYDLAFKRQKIDQANILLTPKANIDLSPVFYFNIRLKNYQGLNLLLILNQDSVNSTLTSLSS
ncbi:hypothetical protein QFZ20_003877 [Flavobacterium sp. W4I14]|nr:hypothetical protein [Flavobacterium sp. W4I14]